MELIINGILLAIGFMIAPFILGLIQVAIMFIISLFIPEDK